MTKNDLIDCHNRIKPFIHNTPVLTSKLINNLTGADIYFKCENFQKMGAFKMRGAANAILKLSDEQKNNGVVTLNMWGLFDRKGPGDYPKNILSLYDQNGNPKQSLYAIKKSLINQSTSLIFEK